MIIVNSSVEYLFYKIPANGERMFPNPKMRMMDCFVQNLKIFDLLSWRKEACK